MGALLSYSLISGLLIAQCVCIINWCNPAAWLMRDELCLSMSIKLIWL